MARNARQPSAKCGRGPPRPAPRGDYLRLPRAVLLLVFFARGRPALAAAARFGAFLPTVLLALEATRLAFARVAARARFGLALRTAGPAVRPAPARARLALVLRATRFAALRATPFAVRRVRGRLRLAKYSFIGSK